MDHPPDARPVGLSALQLALDSQDSSERAEAVSRAVAEPGVEGLLLRALADPHPSVRRAAIGSLTRLEGNRAIRALIEVSAGDVSEEVRTEAVAALGRVLRARVAIPSPETERS